MTWLDNQVALITGGASGLGRAVVERFLDEGAKVAVLDVDRDRLDALEHESDDVLTIHGDVTSFDDNERAVSETVDQFGRLDVFVGNAGVFDDNVSLPELDADDIGTSFAELFEINVLGYLLGARAALPELVETEGRIVFTASQASFNSDGGGILYVPSKHAIAGIVRQLAFELAPTVRVNAVAPGYVPTELSATDTLGGDRAIVTAEEFDASNHPLDIVPTPEDYTGPYVLLASRENSRPMTGTIIRADLGRSVRGITSVAGRAAEFVTDGL
ncbi:2,3-dihydroxy-2,3-dihydrophenylpropionate dehydrogenase [Haloferax elongans ATCC BAA-1513]|uniref:2,3-dihydroxy-2,3-dihydrophenylpropionate dehydrogenase n=1 Tax=Haloferax elongans ATCC BAA-1513 TaxID=1230453 RepID=M0H8X3_HALEO|nr:3-(cis-5,6-dihydroxycyclohexa-1,3-dien-1-yl)propanoate dehydrogenase [Haloferax elongans]ELZ80986.1 2,3-dihydroxy-2,3-dihydrophenylpropionate dehydrogenase [Haloferax elongans ATCC BAA-1513]